MTKRPHKASDGFYHIHGHKYQVVRGTRAQVWHGTAYKSPGGLTRDHLMMNKHGHIVSKKKHATAKRENRLVKFGFGTKKGKFGYVKLFSRKRARGTKKGGFKLSPASVDAWSIDGNGQMNTENFKTVGGRRCSRKSRRCNRRRKYVGGKMLQLLPANV